MARRNLASRKRRGQPVEERTQIHADEEQSDRGADSDPDSDSEAAEEVATPLVPPKKHKFTTPQKLSVPESVENGSACSSPSASGFLVVPSQKPCGKKKGSASKVFSDEDVIAMLKGLAVFWANGRNNKWAEFHVFIKDDLQNQFTKIQVSEKIRSLKKKFDTNLERALANGGRLDLSDPHETAVFELSKALWPVDENGIALEKAQMAENEIRRERDNVSENDEGSKSVKKRKLDANVERSNRMMKRRKQVDENDEGSKKMKKRKQLGEHCEENKKTSEPEHGIEELLGGDERDAANTILSISKLVNGHSEGNKKKRKRKQVDEHDEKRELLKEGIQEDGHDEKREGIQEDGHDEKGELLKEGIQVDEHDEKGELLKEGIQIDEHDEKGELLKEGIQVDEHDGANKIPSKRKQVDERGEGNKKKRKRKQADKRDKAKKTGEQKEVDEHVEKKEIVKDVHQVDQHGENEKLLEEGKQVDEHEEQHVTTRKQKQVDGHEVKKDLVKRGKQVDDHHEENNIPANHKQELEIRAEDFHSAYPLLYASFDMFCFPRVAKENYTLIGRENAQELEEKWREFNAEVHRFELKKLDLMKMDSHRLQGK